uniref:DEAD/SNF2-like helicase n=1 Tax=Pithovirus LCPAC404 TaxID=2506597 RepID=A0A481ZCE5_9VIRU|nr:MAG: DEAD/SNF2-like helicase [Pithovirus LCPAC404]
MVKLKLENLLYSYPSQDDPDIQRKLYQKEEFRQLKLGPSEPIPDPGKYFTHQKFSPRFMRAFDKLFVIHAVGTGKTCYVISAAEYFKDHPELGIDKCVILTHNDAIGDQFKQEIIQICAKTAYFSKFAGEKLNAPHIKGQITRALGSIKVKTDGTLRIRPFVYDVTTHITFGNSMKDKSDSFLRGEYSGTLFVIDEAHKMAARDLTSIKWSQFMKDKENLRNRRQTIVQQRPVESEQKIIQTEEEFEILPELLSEQSVTSSDSDNESILEEKRRESEEFERKISDSKVTHKTTRSELAYMRIHYLFHLVKKSKQMLLTATPMENDPSEFAPLINLLNPSNLQIDKSMNWDKVTGEQLEPYFRGKISYLRSMDTGVDVKVIGTDLEYKVDDIKIHRRLFVSRMSEFQESIYLDVEADMGPKDEGLALPLRLVSNFVLPNGKYGEAIYDGYFNSRRFKLEGILPGMSPEFEEAVDINNLGKYSPKYKKIYEQVDDIEHKYKACLIYTPFVVTGSYILTAIFYVNNYALFISEDMARRNLQDDYRRFATITRHLTAKRRDEIFTTFKSPDNWDGRLIKVLIGSQLILHGLNIGNVSRFFQAGPEWTEAKNYQARGRGLRATSHRYILAKLREEAEAKGEDPANVRTTVDVYQHAAILGLDQLDDSIDTRMYGKAQIKDKRNARIFRFAKEQSVDCYLTRDRNIRATDVPFSPICDYMECNYKCRVPLIGAPIDYTSFNILYINDVIDKLVMNIIPLFSERTRYSIEDIVNTTARELNATDFNLQTDKLPQSYINQAIYRIITEKIPVYDKFGITRYVRDHGDQVFLRCDYPIKFSGDLPSTSYYIENTTATYEDHKEIRVIVNIRAIESLTKLAVTQEGRLNEDFWKGYDKLSVAEKISFLEREIFTFRAKLDPDHQSIYDMLTERLRMFVYEDNEVIVHIMNNQMSIFTKATFTVASGYTAYREVMRILRLHPEQGEIIKWESGNNLDEEKYGPLILQQQKAIELPFNRIGTYGTIATAEGELRIRTRPKGWEKQNKKEISRGMKCINTHKHVLMDTILKYEIAPDIPAGILSPIDMIDELDEAKIDTENLTISKITQMYKQHRIISNDYPAKKLTKQMENSSFIELGNFDRLFDWSDYTKSAMCSEIEEYFKENDLILYI